jgi:hypothetical protein
VQFFVPAGKKAKKINYCPRWKSSETFSEKALFIAIPKRVDGAGTTSFNALSTLRKYYGE